MVVAPWTVRNAVALDRFVPISTGGGQVLFAGTYLASDGDPERGRREVVAPTSRTLRRRPTRGGCGSSRSSRGSPRSAIPDLESDRALSRMGREQLWDDVSEEPLEYAGFVAAKVGRIWSHGPRDVMREPLWEALHWALVAFGLLGLALLARQRRWEALLLATIFLAITAISALLVASPRRVLVMLPLVAALAGAGAATLASAGKTPVAAGIAWAALDAVADRFRALPERHGRATLVAAGADRRARARRCAPTAWSSRSPTPPTTRTPTTRSPRRSMRKAATAGRNSATPATGRRGRRSSTRPRFYATGGAREGTARIVEALLGVAAIVVVFLLGERLGGRRRGLLAAFGVAVYPPVHPLHRRADERAAGDPHPARGGARLPLGERTRSGSCGLARCPGCCSG